jgi:hypothetical protein
MAIAARRSVATSDDGGRSFSPVSSYGIGLLLLFILLLYPLHSSSLLSSVNVHAVFGSGGPR